MRISGLFFLVSIIFVSQPLTPSSTAQNIIASEEKRLLALIKELKSTCYVNLRNKDTNFSNAPYKDVFREVKRRLNMFTPFLFLTRVAEISGELAPELDSYIMSF